MTHNQQMTEKEFFATGGPVDLILAERGEKCEDCGTRFLAEDGFCADDMTMCRACSDKYAEEHPDEVQATGRSF